MSSSELIRMINGYQRSQALHAAAVLGIADLLRDGPRSSGEMAAHLGVDPPTLYRLLRALAAEGVFHEQPGQRFASTALGDALQSEAPGSVAAWARFIGRPYIWHAWSSLLHSVRTGETAFQAAYGEDVWAYRAAHPEEGAIFDEAMTGLSRGMGEAAAAAYDFNRFRRIVDVGGGRGALLAAILTAAPDAEGVVFDQPHVVADAGQVLCAAGVADRCQVVGGSFFDSVPAGDLFVLKAVLHDWDDARCIGILRSCRRAIAAGGRLLVLDRIVGLPNEGPEGKFADLMMLVGTGGQERTLDEFAALFQRAGFSEPRVVPAATRLSLIEAAPA